MVSKAIHFGHNSGFSMLLSSFWLNFISLQLTRTSRTLVKSAAELESNFFLVFCKMSVRNAKSLLPIFGSFSSVAVDKIGFNNLIRNLMQLGDSKRCSSWPWQSSRQPIKTTWVIKRKVIKQEVVANTKCNLHHLSRHKANKQQLNCLLNHQC